MSNGSIDVAWRALFRAIAVLPVAIVVWIPFLFGFLQIFRPIVEFISRLLSGNIVSGISSAGILEWALKTNLIVADKPDQLYEFAVLPQYFLLPFPLVWAGVWACAPRSKRTLYLGLATAITSMAALLPLLLQIMSAAPFAARSIGLHTMLARDFMGRTVLAPYDPAPLLVIQLAAFARTVIVYFNLFVLPALLSVLFSGTLSKARSIERHTDKRRQHAR